MNHRGHRIRRLVSQLRNDPVSSRRDYQTIIAAAGAEVYGGEASYKIRATLPGELIGAGGYVKSIESTTLQLEIRNSSSIQSHTIQLGPDWQRFALAIDNDGSEVTLKASSSNHRPFQHWGIAVGDISELKNGTFKIIPITTLIRQQGAPEFFELDHEAFHNSSHLEPSTRAVIHLKKCAYCGRHLPIIPNSSRLLGFHKHAAKKSGFQNECRNCKNSKINPHFNPLRTTIQHHESSSLTRERKVLLRDNEALFHLKTRLGDGLKSVIWERFNRECFVCKIPLDLASKSFQLDHTRPLAFLWPIDEFATCLCADHNNAKKDRFPVDFYTKDQLIELSRITGLPLHELTARTVNPLELKRIRSDIIHFARAWTPRFFAATSRRIQRLNPDVDLFEDLRAADLELYLEITEALMRRPKPVQLPRKTTK